MLGIEASLPRRVLLPKKKEMYEFSDGKDGYPPHLQVIPGPDRAGQFEIFNGLGLIQAQILVQKIVPQTTFLGKFNSHVKEKVLHVLDDLVAGEPYVGSTIAEVEHNSRHYRKTGTDVMRGETIGDYNDWYSDARYGQQQFTGANPMTITLASSDWISKFRTAADKQGNTNMSQLLKQADAKSISTLR